MLVFQNGNLLWFFQSVLVLISFRVHLVAMSAHQNLFARNWEHLKHLQSQLLVWGWSIYSPHFMFSISLLLQFMVFYLVYVSGKQTFTVYNFSYLWADLFIRTGLECRCGQPFPTQEITFNDSFLFRLTIGVEWSNVAELVETDILSEAITFIQLETSIGVFVSPLLGGTISDRTGDYSYVFFIAGILLLSGQII